jgi:hypothetical protein
MSGIYFASFFRVLPCLARRMLIALALTLVR